MSDDREAARVSPGLDVMGLAGEIARRHSVVVDEACQLALQAEPPAGVLVHMWMAGDAHCLIADVSTDVPRRTIRYHHHAPASCPGPCEDALLGLDPR